MNGKHRDCAQVGIASIRRGLPDDVSHAEVDAVVDELNADPSCTGYIVQLPLPRARCERRAEADGSGQGRRRLHPVNLGRLVLGEPGPLPCTPRGIVQLLRRYGVADRRRGGQVIGRGTTVGRALGLMLTRRSENATVTLCHTGTKDLAAHIRTADIVVAGACGGPDHRGHDQSGAAVVDVGIARTGGLGRCGPRGREVAGWLVPNPRGVGPMTRAILLANVVEAAERSNP